MTRLILIITALISLSTAQFGFFDQMFGGGGGGGGSQQRGEPQNVRSDSSWYQAQYEGGTCSISSVCQSLVDALTMIQHNARITYALARFLAFTFRIIVPVRGAP